MTTLPKRVAFFGSMPLGLKCFEYLLNFPDVKVVALLTHKPRSGPNIDEALHKRFIDLSKKHSVSVVESENDLLNFNLDIGFSVHYMKIIKKPLINRFSLGIVNLHPGPLPEYRGTLPFVHAIYEGKTDFGTTIHFIDEGVDSGPIIKTSACPIGPDETSWQLFVKLKELLYNDFVSALPLLLSGKVKGTPQEEIIKTTGIQPKTYTRAMLGKERKINPAWPKEKIANYLRAFKFPGIEPAYILNEETKS